MDVTILGSGSADGWPNPFCDCASCTAVRASGTARTHTSALVDDTLLLDCGPDVPRAATAAGRSLAGVRFLLFTHSHPDHVGPAALLWRSWVRRAEPLVVAGPEAALALCREWVGPDDPVEFRPVSAGEQFHLGPYELRALPATHGGGYVGEALLYDVRSADPQGGEHRLLYATDTGPFSEAALTAMAGAAYDLVLLEETFGPYLDHGTEHLDFGSFPRQLARLREVGATTAASQVVAVHLSHHNPPEPELGRRLALWGAVPATDGLQLRAGRDAAPIAAPMSGPDRTLILGGARSGKSSEAERRLQHLDQVTYVATAFDRPDDLEWRQRVKEHQARRPATWTTVETQDVAAVLRAAVRGDYVLVDCLALWTGALIDDSDGGGTGSDPNSDTSSDTNPDTEDRIAALTQALRHTQATVVLVSNEVGSGVVPATAAGRQFRDLLGRVNAAVAAECDQVLLVTAGITQTLKALPRKAPHA